MTLHAPQIIYLTISLIGLGIMLQQHGTPKTGKYDARGYFVAFVIVQALLYWGGFYG